MDRLQRFGRWAAELDLTDVPHDVVRRAELQLANQVAAANAAGELPDDDVDSYSRVWKLSASSVRFDYDDYLFAAHSGHSAVWSSLAACRERGLGTEDLLESIVVANEVEGRLGAAVAVGPHNGQMWAFVHAAGSAAVTARLDGDADAVADAVGVALYSPNWPTDAGFMSGDAKRFTASAPAAAGMRYGEEAVDGAERADDALKGFLEEYAYLPAPEFIGGWGDSWVTRTLSYKPRPGCAYVQAPLECFERIVDEEGVHPDDVDTVDVHAALLAVGMENLGRRHRPTDRLPEVSVNFSVALTLALHAQAGEVSTESLSPTELGDVEEEVRGYADRVSLHHDWGQTLDVLRGVGAAVDVGSLLSTRSRRKRLKALRRMRSTHDTVPTRREALRLVRGRQTRELLSALKGPLDWSEFDVGKAEFEELEFGFGAHVEVDVDGESYVEEVDSHRGSTDRPLEEARDVVGEKLEREVGDGFEIFDGAVDSDLEEITGLL